MADRTTDVRHTSLRGTMVIAGLLLVLVVLWVGPMLFAPEVADEAFPGADAQAAEMVEDTGYEPWAEPVFEPSGEVESGTFALQAAIGAGVLFYVIGHLHGRSLARRAMGSGATSVLDDRDEA